MATTNPAPPRYHVRRVWTGVTGSIYEVRPYRADSDLTTTHCQTVQVLSDGGPSLCSCRRHDRAGHCPHIAAVLAQ